MSLPFLVSRNAPSSAEMPPRVVLRSTGYLCWTCSARGARHGGNSLCQERWFKSSTARDHEDDLNLAFLSDVRLGEEVPSWPRVPSSWSTT